MANLNYAGESIKIEGTLTDSDGTSVLFDDVVTMTIEVFDERGISYTYTKADSEIVEGSTTSSYALEVPGTDTTNFIDGEIKMKATIVFPSDDFTGNATDIICEDLLTLSRCP